MIFLICCAQSPVKTCNAAFCSAAPIASNAPESQACCAAASTTAANRRLVARAALQVSLITSDPAKRAIAKSLGCGPVQATPPPLAATALNLSSQRASSLRLRVKTFFSTALTTCSA
eukprot:260058-Pleurochrysis_carterae.AAC.2